MVGWYLTCLDAEATPEAGPAGARDLHHHLRHAQPDAERYCPHDGMLLACTMIMQVVGGERWV